MQQENNFKGIVYKAQNKETGEMYIGVTTTSIEARKKDHIDKTRQGEETKFYEAIGTYGAEAFSWEQIDTANSVNELAAKEREYVLKYNAQEDGYNTDAGGGIQKQVYQYNLVTNNLVAEYDCLEDAAKSINADKKAISKACYSVNQIYGGYYWSYVKEEIFTPKKDARNKTVLQLTLAGKFVNGFPSVAQAARETGVSKSGIAKTCRGVNKTAGGYLWKYK